MVHNYEQITDYLNGTLTGNDLRDFEAKLQADTAFAEVVNIYREIETSMAAKYQHSTQNAELKSTLDTLNQKYFNSTAATQATDKPSKGKVANMRIKGFVIAAVSAAAILLLMWLSPWQQENLFDQYYQPTALNLTERGTSNDLTTAEQAYEAQDYTTALPAFEQHLASHPEATNIHIALGNCQLNTGQMEQAVATFQQIADGGSIYASEADWYLAMTYLKLEKVEQAKVVFEKIPEGADHYEAARKLLRKL